MRTSFRDQPAVMVSRKTDLFEGHADRQRPGVTRFTR
jgi:hypothetical protein